MGSLLDLATFPHSFVPRPLAPRPCVILPTLDTGGNFREGLGVAFGGAALCLGLRGVPTRAVHGRGVKSVQLQDSIFGPVRAAGP